MQKTWHNARPINSGLIIVRQAYLDFARSGAWLGRLAAAAF